MYKYVSLVLLNMSWCRELLLVSIGWARTFYLAWPQRTRKLRLMFFFASGVDVVDNLLSWRLLSLGSARACKLLRRHEETACHEADR